MTVKTVHDVRQLLKRFGTYIYSRDRMGDLILMESELEDLLHLNFITKKEYVKGKLILQKEINRLEQKERGGYE
jgi:uncharacterized protein YqgQ